MNLVSSQKLFQVIALLAIVGCGCKGETSEASRQAEELIELPEYSDPIPLADGSCYVKRTVQKGGSFYGRRYFFIQDRTIQRVQPDVSFSEVIPMADGSAIGLEDEQIWRLTGAIAERITETTAEQKSSRSLSNPSGFYFAQLHREKRLRAIETEDLLQQLDEYGYSDEGDFDYGR
jgi:hypothetical protein